MSYIQSNNPLSRKTSPINKVNPYEKGLGGDKENKQPGIISGINPETESTSAHHPSEHHPKLEGQPMPAGGPYGQDYEHIEDLKEAGVDPEPDYESDDYKSPLNDNTQKPSWMGQQSIDGTGDTRKSTVAPKKPINSKEAYDRKKEHKAGVSRKSSSPLNKDGKWIQKATASIKERGTEGVCTGDKFGSASCPPGSKRYTLAKTFKKMARNRKK